MSDSGIDARLERYFKLKITGCEEEAKAIKDKILRELQARGLIEEERMKNDN